MSTDPHLDHRLRAGLANAAEKVDPPVPYLLEKAHVRGHRRIVVRRTATAIALLAVVALPVAFGVVASKLGGRDATHPTQPVAYQPVRDPAQILGTWETDALPAAAWMSMYQRAGGTAEAASNFVGTPMNGPARAYRVLIKVTQDGWVTSVIADSKAAREGWNGSSVLVNSVVKSIDRRYGCQASYRLGIAGSDLRVVIAGDTCGGSDLLSQRAIYETGIFHRVS